MLSRQIETDTLWRASHLLEPRNKDFEKLKEVIMLLVSGEKLPAKCKDHKLKGILKDCRECHTALSWNLIYRIEGSELCLVRTGSQDNAEHIKTRF